MERLSVTDEGLVAYRLRHAHKGRATHRVMSQLEFMARLSAVIPPPRHPLLRYYGVFAPHSTWRKLCVPTPATDNKSPEVSDGQCVNPGAQTRPNRASGSKASACAVSKDATALSKVTTVATDAGRYDAHEPMFASATALNAWRIDWAMLLRRTYDVDILACECGGRLKFIELVTDRVRAQELLTELGLPSVPPPLPRARAPDW